MQNELLKAERDHNFCHHHSGEVGLLLNQLESYLLQLFFLRRDSEFSCKKVNVGEGIIIQIALCTDFDRCIMTSIFDGHGHVNDISIYIYIIFTI